MIPKQKTEKNPNEKCKRSLLPNSVINKNILDSKNNYKSNTNKSTNKYSIKRIKNNSLAYFANKKLIKKNEVKNKVNVLNINLLHMSENKRNNSDKKNKILNRVNNSKNQDNLFNICQLTHLLRNANLKQTIIIDNDGNNNLDLIMNENKKFSEIKAKNVKNKTKFEKEELKDENITKNKFLNKLYDSNNQFNLKIDNNKTQNIFTNNNNNVNSINNIYGKNEESCPKKNDKDIKRLNEYNQIFQLLNENIEQFKNILKKKDSNIDNKENKKNNLNLYKNDRTNDKMKYILSNNKEEEESSIRNNINSNNNNNNMAHNINANNSLNKSYSHNFIKDKNSEIYSFIDSFTQDDLFLPYNTKHQKNSSKSLSNILKIENKNKINKKIIKKDIERFSSNESTNKCYDDEEMQIEFSDIDEQIKCNKLKNRDINPHFFSYDFVNNINSKSKKKINLDKDCIIF